MSTLTPMTSGKGSARGLYALILLSMLSCAIAITSMTEHEYSSIERILTFQIQSAEYTSGWLTAIYLLALVCLLKTKQVAANMAFVCLYSAAFVLCLNISNGAIALTMGGEPRVLNWPQFLYVNLLLMLRMNLFGFALLWLPPALGSYAGLILFSLIIDYKAEWIWRMYTIRAAQFLPQYQLSSPLREANLTASPLIYFSCLTLLSIALIRRAAQRDIGGIVLKALGAVKVKPALLSWALLYIGCCVMLWFRRPYLNLGLGCLNIFNTAIIDNDLLWLLFPVASALPYSFALADDLSTGHAERAILRFGANKYAAAKCIASFMAVFSVFAAALLAFLLTLQLLSPYPSIKTAMPVGCVRDLYNRSYLLYCLVFILYTSAMAGALSLVALGIAGMARNRALGVFALPAIYLGSMFIGWIFVERSIVKTAYDFIPTTYFKYEFKGLWTFVYDFFVMLALGILATKRAIRRSVHLSVSRPTHQAPDISQ